MSAKSTSNDTDLFVVLGASHPQRIEVVFQMIEYLQFNGEQVTLCLHEEEKDLPDSPTKTRLIQKGLHITQWQIDPQSATFTTTPATEDGNTVIMLGHGSRYLVDTLEALMFWLPNSGFSLQRITTWVDCQRYADSADTKHWYECCFHFSDLIILDEFKDLPLSWLKEFRDEFKTKCYPCIIENTKKGRLHDLYLVMDNQVRRISQVFENTDDLYFDEEDEIEDDAVLEDEEILNSSATDPFFERSIDGRRSKPVPEPK